MKVTIRDVAREAGVSVATVSRVLNDSGPVSEGARARILEIAGRLRYTPNEAARTLISSRTSALGVILPDLHGQFFSEVIRGLDQAAKASGYHLLVSGSHNDCAETEAALQAMRGRVDGLVVMAPDVDTARVVAGIPTGVPVVLLNCPALDGRADSIEIDNYGGAYAIVAHLSGPARRAVAVIAGTANNRDAAERLRGYRAALRDLAVDQTPRWELEGDFTEASGYEAVRHLLRLRSRPPALFASNDSMAIGAMSALREAGLRVPEDVAVGGFDDIPMARYTSPPLTSVRVPMADLGAQAVRRLVDVVGQDARHVTRRETLATELVVRTSCGMAVAPTAERPTRPASRPIAARGASAATDQG
ncbi:MAG TPA: LacI family DNA-binding transcriptional regulator [Vicinamibacterales bacterium]|nr:LacI family DNA-binding transcriptional regulator [Vicinamibacterales bacterium]